MDAFLESDIRKKLVMRLSNTITSGLSCDTETITSD